MTARKDEAALLNGWLSGGPQELAETILRAGTPRHKADGETVYNQGDAEAGIYGIASGHVRMFFTLNEQDPLLGHIAGPGFWFGEVALILGGGRLVGAITSGATVLHFVSLAAIERIAQSEPSVWRCICGLSARNQALAIGAAEDLMIRDSKQRLVAVLLRFANLRNAFQGTPPILDVPVTQPELAEAACLSRTTATDILRDLSRLGWIEPRYRSIRILDPEALSSVMRP